MGQFFSKGMCPQCHQVTLTSWPLLPGQKHPRRSCSNPSCHFAEKGD